MKKFVNKEWLGSSVKKFGALSIKMAGFLKSHKQAVQELSSYESWGGVAFHMEISQFIGRLTLISSNYLT